MAATTVDAPMGANIGKWMVELAYSGWFLSKIALGLISAAALFGADTFVGAQVLTEILNDGKLAWAISVAQSGVILALTGFAVARKGIAWMLVVPAVILTIPDLMLDSRYPTFRLYGREVLMSSGLVPPDASFTWGLLEAVFTGVTLLGEFGILLIFAWLLIELKRVGVKARVTLPSTINPEPAAA